MSNNLKKLRVAVSIIVLLLLGFLLVDFRQVVPEQWIYYITRFQLIPAIISVITISGFAVISLIILLLLTLLFGRIYCSTLCPLGAFQDVLTRFFNPQKKNRRFKYHKPANWLRYLILAATVIFFIFGSSLLLNLLEPYSNFGKMISNLVRPVYMYLNNVVATTLAGTGNYTVTHIQIKGFQTIAIVYSLLFLGVVGFLSAWRGRLFCNTLCPAGTLLSLFSRKSVFRFYLDKEKCNSCGLCAIACKAECIDPVAKTVDMSRCIGCFNCLSACKSFGVHYNIPGKTQPVADAKMPDQKRRFLLGGLVASAVAISGIKALAQQRRGLGRRRQNREPVPIHREYPLAPPGAQSFSHLNANCTACHLCVTACPKQIIVPAFTEYGLQGIMQPRLDYSVSFCNYECLVCSSVCPTGAIKPLNSEQKKATQVGIAYFVRRNCVVIIDKTDCGACAEHCPTQAVRMIPHGNGLFIPEVTPEICVGCGACEYACPTDPKSIYVDGNPVHQKAKEPVSEALDKEVDFDDFPF
jgi:ferredoxin